MVTKQQLEKLYGWYYMQKNRDEEMFPLSGWKLHIFGESVEDSFTIASSVESIVYEYNLSMKIATSSVIKAGIGNPTHEQYGKCVVIYLSPELFRQKSVIKSFITKLQNALSLSGYDKKGNIVGSKSIDDIIFYRYELSKVIDIQKGVDFFEYVKLYEKNRHYFNIEGNPDIESYFR